METFAERVIEFNRNLDVKLDLPAGIRVMNPFSENPEALRISSLFYRKFYNDNRQRRLILGINPGRHGAGVTGIPFTDTKRLAEKCKLAIAGLNTHEPSSVFIYEVIDAYGGPERFYSDFYINSPCPLGFVKTNDKGKEVNFNYYDSKELAAAVYPFMLRSIGAHIAKGIDTEVAYCLGSGKNYKTLERINREQRYFGKLIPLEHPRFIMQYRSKQKQSYIEKYLEAFRSG
ncbi:MAG: SMUG2 DNA glycosylase family protein [Marinilabiliales bacterium]|nr:MAG: SMUG2 DNA glycosylase family protein [Marinilabiliales bacterium]